MTQQVTVISRYLSGSEDHSDIFSTINDLKKQGDNGIIITQLSIARRVKEASKNAWIDAPKKMYRNE